MGDSSRYRKRRETSMLCSVKCKEYFINLRTGLRSQFKGVNILDDYRYSPFLSLME